jgi:hypothetical protein
VEFVRFNGDKLEAITDESRELIVKAKEEE